MNKEEKLKKAARLYEDFRGNPAEFVDELNIKFPDVAIQVGFCDGILYTTNRNGKTEKYIHEFKKDSRPLLASSEDGSMLLLLGGAFAFTDRGIVDNG